VFANYVNKLNQDIYKVAVAECRTSLDSNSLIELMYFFQFVRKTQSNITNKLFYVAVLWNAFFHIVHFSGLAMVANSISRFQVGI
jgi:hypothetical protein